MFKVEALGEGDILRSTPVHSCFANRSSKTRPYARLLVSTRHSDARAGAVHVFRTLLVSCGWRGRWF